MSHPEAEPISGHRIAGVARSIEAASTGLIDVIDGTVDTMIGIENVMRGFMRTLSSFAEQVDSAAAKEGQYLDQDDEAIDALSQASDGLKNFLTRLVIKRGTIDKDARLHDHHREALHDAYEAASTTVAELIEAAQETRAAIIRHDLKAEPRTGDPALCFSGPNATEAHPKSL